jgi:ADP-heptose:LPS heptosyltransferase
MIIIHPYSSKLRDNRVNPKNYPYWSELIKLLQTKYTILQIGVQGEEKLVSDFKQNLPLKTIKSLLTKCEFWISVDSFLPHLAHKVGKPGYVLWSVSDPEIYGYPENINIMKDRKYLRSDQYLDYHRPCFVDDYVLDYAMIKEAHTEPEKVFNIIISRI